MAQAHIRIGTSGWLYKHWRAGAFYPKGLKQKDEFAHYAGAFDTVEINGSFYRLPSEKSVRAWAEAAPEGFLFAWKYPRWLTHYYRLKDPEESYKLVFGRMSLLGEAEGPALFQITPRLHMDAPRLEAALKKLPKAKHVAFEFRHPSWYKDEIFALLAQHDCALCISDHHDAPAPWEETASWLYVRGHGPKGDYQGGYPEKTLALWARRIRAAAREGRDVFCYFDNDIGAHAPKDAHRINQMLKLE